MYIYRVSHQDTENMNQSGVASVSHMYTRLLFEYKNTSYLTEYIILPVSDHTVLPPLLPFEALQLQHTPTVAVYLQRICFIPVRVITVIIAVGMSLVVSYKNVLLPFQRLNTLPLESHFGLMEDPNQCLYKFCQDEHFKTSAVFWGTMTGGSLSEQLSALLNHLTTTAA